MGCGVACSLLLFLCMTSGAHGFKPFTKTSRGIQGIRLSMVTELHEPVLTALQNHKEVLGSLHDRSVLFVNCYIPSCTTSINSHCPNIET